MTIIHGVNDLRILPRAVLPGLGERLGVMPAVVVTGARQTGKSTLAEPPAAARSTMKGVLRWRVLRPLSPRPPATAASRAADTAPGPSPHIGTGPDDSQRPEAAGGPAAVSCQVPVYGRIVIHLHQQRPVLAGKYPCTGGSSASVLRPLAARRPATAASRVADAAPEPRPPPRQQTGQPASRDRWLSGGLLLSHPTTTS